MKIVQKRFISNVTDFDWMQIESLVDLPLKMINNNINIDKYEDDDDDDDEDDDQEDDDDDDDVYLN